VREADAIVPVLARHVSWPDSNSRPRSTAATCSAPVRTVFIGLSARTKEEGAEQLARLLEPHGIARARARGDRLHLKSSASWLGGEIVAGQRALPDRPELRASAQCGGRDRGARCNTLLVNGTLLTPAGFPKRGACSKRRDCRSSSWISRGPQMDGGLTCMVAAALIFVNPSIWAARLRTAVAAGQSSRSTVPSRAIVISPVRKSAVARCFPPRCSPA